MDFQNMACLLDDEVSVQHQVRSLALPNLTFCNVATPQVRICASLETILDLDSSSSHASLAQRW